ncbi:hypothetical protein EXU48_15965 [Occultella glacieicola]|uniref:Uncharacterized protein n=1 Tax=Occultella glacieicola TaxID=2518684 RepID=A0ABY2E236_9MICO|nr:hypothetical protein [Occultella glacieicola]TDE91635.1 hypothetical protein EXU48_15965 [Occultella glacieicola]
MGTSKEHIMDLNQDIRSADLAYRREHLLADLGSRKLGSRRTGLRRMIDERRARREAASRGLDPADLIKQA